ncbi:hypothetical protein [Nocardia nova]|nr:hypothetical protein [Nocardia nova]
MVLVDMFSGHDRHHRHGMAGTIEAAIFGSGHSGMHRRNTAQQHEQTQHPGNPGNSTPIVHCGHRAIICPSTRYPNLHPGGMSTSGGAQPVTSVRIDSQFTADQPQSFLITTDGGTRILCGDFSLSEQGRTRGELDRPDVAVLGIGGIALGPGRITELPPARPRSPPVGAAHPP